LGEVVDEIIEIKNPTTFYFFKELGFDFNILFEQLYEVAV